MNKWDSQHYRKAGEKYKADQTALANAISTAKKIVCIHKDLPPIFTLRHLAHLIYVDYGFLRAIVSRKLDNPYKTFKLKKSGTTRGFRVIAVPSPELMKAQRWIARNILSKATPHSASRAYAKESNIKDAASLHSDCRWLIKLDIQRFFESISEISVYRVFLSLGYQPLVALELTRICTRESTKTRLQHNERWHVKKDYIISSYSQSLMGHLPQGAPTSPMLSNLVMKEFDAAVLKIAEKNNLSYSRYADDIALSTSDKKFNRKIALSVIGSVYAEMSKQGLSPNLTKTKILSPASRKMVLGLLVNGPNPRLSREFRATMRQHFYYLLHPNFGPIKHAEQRKFHSVLGLKNHIAGLVAYATSIDPKYGAQCTQEYLDVNWPL